MRLDLDHAASEELERGLVFLPRAFEVKPDLEAAVAGMVPGLVVELGAVVMQLHQAATAASGLDAAHRCRQPRFHSLSQSGEEVRRGEERSACQLSDYGPATLP